MRRVVITGVGLVTPLGVGAEDNWAALRAGRAGVRELTGFDASRMPVKIAAEVGDFSAPTSARDRRASKMYHRNVRYALGAVGMAFADAGLAPDALDRSRLGIAMACGEVGTRFADFQPAVRAALKVGGEFDFAQFANRGIHQLDPYFMLRSLPTNGLCFASIAYQAKGPTVSTASATAAGAQAVGEAARIIEGGETEVMIAGAYDSLVLPEVLLHHYRLGLLADGDGDPASAVRPFDRARRGYALAEGAGAVVLESADHARRRGARVLAELVGYGLGFDVTVDGQEPNGRGTARAVRYALADAGLRPDEIDLVKLEGDATPDGDRAEWRGVSAALGPAAATTPAWALKGAWGHQGAAAGVTELIAAGLALRAGVLPPTRNFDAPDPGVAMTVVRGDAKPARLRHVLAVSRGLGGQSAALVLRAPAGALPEACA
jgi:3-oxoacyl-[acyl-carrier-protein] synthase II